MYVRGGAPARAPVEITNLSSQAMMAHTLLAMQLILAMGVRGDDEVCAGGAAACADGCVCHPSVCDRSQTCTPGAQTGWSVGGDTRYAQECGACQDYPIVGVTVTTGSVEGFGAENDGVYIRDVSLPPWSSRDDTESRYRATCNGKLVYLSARSFSGDLKPAFNFLFQPTGTQHWRIIDVRHGGGVTENNVAWSWNSCADEGTIFGTNFVSSDDCANDPGNCSSWQSGFWWMSDEPDMSVVSHYARAGCSNHSDCAGTEVCGSCGVCTAGAKQKGSRGCADAATSMLVGPELVATGPTTAYDPLLVGLVAALALIALFTTAAAVHYRREAVVDAKPLQEGEEREQNVARDSTAETATLAGKSMKQTSDASYP